MFLFGYILSLAIPCSIVILLLKTSERSKLVNKMIKGSNRKRYWIILPAYLLVIICISLGIRNLELSNFPKVEDEKQIPREELDRLERGFRLKSVTFDEIKQNRLIVSNNSSTFAINGTVVDASNAEFDYIAVKENNELKDEIKISVCFTRYINYEPYYIDMTDKFKLPNVKVVDNKILFDRSKMEQIEININKFYKDYYSEDEYFTWYSPSYCIITMEVPSGTKVDTHSLINIQKD